MIGSFVPNDEYHELFKDYMEIYDIPRTHIPEHVEVVLSNGIYAHG